MPLIVQYENENCKHLSERVIKPIKINKTRRKDFNEYYEVAWKKLSSEDNSDSDLSQLTEYFTLERFDVLEACFPKLIKEYQDMIEAKKAFRSMYFFRHFNQMRLECFIILFILKLP